MLITIVQIALAVFQNGVPAGGVVFRGWSPATALTLYWCENLVATILIAVRIAVHRRLTRKNGHYVTVVDMSKPNRPRSRSTYLAGFLTLSLGFTLVHGVLLAAMLLLVAKMRPDLAQVTEGLKWMSLAQVIGLGLDLTRIRSWPFAQLKKSSDSLMGRVLLIQFSILGGMIVAGFSTRPQTFFAVFGVLKTLADVTSLIPFNPQPTEKAPAWFLKFARLFPNRRAKFGETDLGPEAWWRQTHLKEREQAEEDERVAPL